MILNQYRIVCYKDQLIYFNFIMNSTKNKSLIKWPKINNIQTSKTSRKSSHQIVNCQLIKLNELCLDKQILRNHLASYPIAPQKKQIRFLNEQNDEQKSLNRKTSAFLSNYNQKLKRQRKRQDKRKSDLNPRFFTTNQTKFSFNIFSPPKKNENSPQKTVSQILVLKKTSFFDTSNSNFFKTQKDFQKQLKFKQLLKEITKIKKEQQTQIQRVNNERFMTLDYIRNQQANQKLKRTQYYNGFQLPIKMLINQSRKASVNNASKTLINDRNSFQKLEKIRKKSMIFNCHSNKQQLSYKSVNHKQNYQYQTLYNFKQLQPWVIPKQTSKTTPIHQQTHFQ